MISLLQEQTPDSIRLCEELLKSPRSDAVWTSAATALHGYEGLDSPFDFQVAMARFAPSPAKKEVVVVAPVVERQHVVKEGESLWKIARGYNMKVDELVQMNPKAQEKLYPGMVLKIKE